MTASDHGERPPGDVVLNAAMVRVLMWGAGIRTDSDLARTLGVSHTRLSRTLAAECPPSAAMIHAIMTRWPLVPYARLFVDRGSQDTPQRYGLTDTDVWPLAPDPEGT